MTNHIGIIGVSPEGAAVFFRQIVRHSGRLRAPNDQPRFSVHNEPLSAYLDAIRKDDWLAVGKLLRRSAELVARCGAEFCLTPDNVVQHGVQLAEVGSPIPWLTMTDLVAETVAKDGRQRVGIIGTSQVVMSSTYQTHLGLRGVKVTPPTEAEARLLDEVIYGELLYGHIRPESQSSVLSMIAQMASQGCQGVILASSEAPLIITPENCPLPIYDAADILAEAAVRRTLRRN